MKGPRYTWACRAHFVDKVDGRAKLAEVTKIKKKKKKKKIEDRETVHVHVCKVEGSVPLQCSCQLLAGAHAQLYVSQAYSYPSWA